MTFSIVSRICAAASVCAAVLILAGSLSLQAQDPAGSLTITVRELSNGDVLFEAGGTSAMLQDGNFSTTNFDPDAVLPPHNNSMGNSTSLPYVNGLKLTVPDRAGDGILPEPENGAEEVPGPGTVDIPLDWIYFNFGGYWHLGTYSSGNLLAGDPITGSGRATIPQSTIPFSDFIPGTFATRKKGWSMGEELYDLTYQVIPYDLRLAASRPAPFRPTRVRKKGPTRHVTVRNIGTVPIENLRIDLSGPAFRDFSAGPVLPGSLAPGGTAKIAVSFRPHAKGLRRAFLTVTGDDGINPPAPFVPSRRIPAEGESEPGPEPEPLPAISVSVQVPLQGTGLPPKPKRKPKFRPNTPRFPTFFP